MHSETENHGEIGNPKGVLGAEAKSWTLAAVWGEIDWRIATQIDAGFIYIGGDPAIDRY